MTENEEVRASALGGFIKVVGDDKTVIDKSKLKYIHYARASIVAVIGTGIMYKAVLPAVGISSTWALAQLPLLWIISYWVGGSMFENIVENDRFKQMLTAMTGEDRELVIE